MAISNSMILQIAALKNVVKSGNITSNFLMRITNRMNNVSLYSTASPEAVPKEESAKVAAPKKMSKAMLAYLERAKSHDAFMKKEEAEYQIGKRHLANMMGEDPEHFTQKDIDRSIEYLFPSGLFDKAARPSMRPPSDIYPPRKAAEFDETGRPFHSLFYTTRPNFYQALYDIAENYQMLNNLEDEMHRKVKPQAPVRLNMGASEWYTYDQFNKFLLEEVTEEDYQYFISSIIRLTNHPYAYQCIDFIMKFRKLRPSVTETSTLLPVEQSFDGRPCVTARDCMRKSARGVVTVIGNGTGKITVNGQTLINYFSRAQDREQIIFPLQFCKVMGEVDVEAEVHGGGPTGQSGAIRWGIAWCLRSIKPDTIEKMRLAGLVTRDWRRRERKKPGQEGARRKFTWLKR